MQDIDVPDHSGVRLQIGLIHYLSISQFALGVFWVEEQQPNQTVVRGQTASAYSNVDAA